MVACQGSSQGYSIGICQSTVELWYVSSSRHDRPGSTVVAFCEKSSAEDRLKATFIDFWVPVTFEAGIPTCRDGATQDKYTLKAPRHPACSESEGRAIPFLAEVSQRDPCPVVALGSHASATSTEIKANRKYLVPSEGTLRQGASELNRTRGSLCGAHVSSNVWRNDESCRKLEVAKPKRLWQCWSRHRMRNEGAGDQGFLLKVAADEMADGESGRMLLTGRAFELWVASPRRSSVGLRNRSSVDVDQEDLARCLPADLRSQALFLKPARGIG